MREDLWVRQPLSVADLLIARRNSRVPAPVARATSFWFDSSRPDTTAATVALRVVRERPRVTTGVFPEATLTREDPSTTLA
jgi:hypothetical protein